MLANVVMGRQLTWRAPRYTNAITGGCRHSNRLWRGCFRGAGFVETDIDNIVGLFNVFNEATHGAAGKHGYAKRKAIRTRVENSIILATVAT